MPQDHHHEHDEPSALQGYFDWQVTTLMLAYDLRNPIDRGDVQGAMQRRKHVEHEVSDMTLALIPDVYKNDASLAWPPSIMMAITRATVAKAAEIIGIPPASDA